MRIDTPCASHIPALWKLWQEAFGDEDAFLEGFFQNANAACRCVMEDQRPVAMLYWLDYHWEGGRLAYIYGVATAKSHQKRGLCRKLMADTLAHLKENGYCGAALVPADESLRQFYGTMGFANGWGYRKVTAQRGQTAAGLDPLSPGEYLMRYRNIAPKGSPVLSEKHSAFLQQCAALYGGEDFLLAVSREPGEVLMGDFFGNPEVIPGILQALHKEKAELRMPGDETPHAMYCIWTGKMEISGFFAPVFD